MEGEERCRERAERGAELSGEAELAHEVACGQVWRCMLGIVVVRRGEGEVASYGR